MVQPNSSSPREFCNYWYFEIGVNVIPVDSKTNTPSLPWKGWQKKSVPLDQHISWSQDGIYDSGIGIITGEINRGEYQGKYLACIDIYNKEGIRQFLSIFKNWDSLEKLAQITIVEQHEDAKDERAHIYFVVDRPLKKRSTALTTTNTINDTIDDNQFPKIEVKSDETTLVVCAPSIHKQGYPYKIIGTLAPAIHDKETTEILDQELGKLFDGINLALKNNSKIIAKKENNTNGQDRNRSEEIEKEKEQRITDIEKLLTIIQQRYEDVFLDQLNETYVTIRVNGHLETLSISDKRFENIIISEYFESEKLTLSKDKLSSVLGLIKARAELNPDITRRELNLRVAKSSVNNKNEDKDNHICYYYDLINMNWQLVKITSEKWEIISNNENPIFKRYRNNNTQVIPNRNYPAITPKKFLNLFNYDSKEDELLFLVYLVYLLIPDTAKPILILRGSKGSAKTTAFELIKKIVDPSNVDTLFFPKEINDLIQILSHNYLVYFDNISFLSPNLSDLLCRATTGTGFSKRKLYSDDEEINYKIKRGIGINGINLATARPDFLDRSLIIELERISNKKRRKDEDIKSEFQQMIPDILGWIFDMLVKVLKYLKGASPDKIKLKEYPRMAEFAEYGEIISRCIGYKEDEFIKVYFNNIEIQNEEAIESSLVAKVIIEFIENRDNWEGSVTELLSILTTIITEKNERLARSKAWPNTANSLSRRINEIASTLKDKGIGISHSYDNKRKSRIIHLRNVEKISSLSSYRSNNNELDKTDNETSVFNFVNSEKIEKEEESELSKKALKYDYMISEVGQNNNKDDNKIINIHKIADRIYEHSDVWVCKTCDHKGDKWDLLNHHPYCRNNKK
jgi:hypothetical protein